MWMFFFFFFKIGLGEIILCALSRQKNSHILILGVELMLKLVLMQS